MGETLVAAPHKLGLTVREEVCPDACFPRGLVQVNHEQPKPVVVNSEPAETRESPVRAARRPQVPTSAEPTLARYVWTALDGWPTILVVWAATMAAGVFYIFATTPIYYSDAVVQVEPKARGLTGLEELLNQGPIGPAETEMALIRSRSSLNQIVDGFGMELSVSPRRFPIIGGPLARRYKGVGLAPSPPGLGAYAWGGERLKLTRLDVPDELLDIPMRLTVLDEGGYRIQGDEGTVLIEGQVGKPAAVEHGQDRITALVAELVARPGTQFDLVKGRRSDLVASLQKRLKITEDGKLSGVLVVSLEGPDPSRIAAILDAVTANYLRQNVERKSAEAAQQLAFLDSQLPIAKANAAAAEVALNKFLRTHGRVNLSTETQAVLDRAAAIEREISALDMQASDLRQRFTTNHPAFATLNEKMQMLRAERAGINAKLQQMPEAEADSARLQRDLRVATDLYNLVFNKAQELRIVKSGSVGNVRIIDPAIVPNRPAWPKPGVVLALSMLLGVMGGVGAAFVKKAMSEGAEDGEEIEASIGLAVYATVVHSNSQQELAARRHRGDASSGRVLAGIDPQDAAIESIRSLRTSLQFALVESRHNVISVSGPAPGVGKTFICVNLGYVLAAKDHRVLIIDGDLRRGSLHHHFGAKRRPGVSDVLSEAVPLSSAILTTDNPSLDILPSGSIPPNPVELLSSQRFSALLEKLSRSYAYVLVDTPPALAVTDATIVACLADVNLLVLKAGAHSMREIALCVKRFTQAGSAVHGAVLNDMRVTAGRYGRHGRYQRYDYRSGTT
jgi:tyrosine-protein kinase Etk/Wzc